MPRPKLRSSICRPMFALASVLLGACADPPPQPEVLALPGMAYFPESLHAAEDGTLYVGSLTTGELVAYDEGSITPRVVIAAGADGVTGETGVFVHGDQLWICSVDATFQRPTEVREFDLKGVAKASYALAATQFCNDLAFDKAGTLYATDSFSGTIQRLPHGAAAFETWITDPRFMPSHPGAFGLDGIAYDGGDALYVNNLDTGALFRVSISTATITPITVTPPLVGPDGLRALDDHTLVVIEGGANRLSKLSILGSSASSTWLSTTLDQPTGVAIARGSAWVTEGQLGRLLAMPSQAPQLPFAVRRVAY